MIERIKSFFNASMSSAARDTIQNTLHKKHLAAAALMIEVLKSDFEYRDEEWAALRMALEEDLELTHQEIEQVIELADAEVEHAVSLHGFTRCINNSYSAQERVDLIEMLWRVAWADDVLSDHEQHLMRKISSLLYIPHKDYIGAKQRARHHSRKTA
ncbi:MAG TPA: hypothetical protein DDW55_02910 [Gammaproteobacteria bacterium]|nr:hypothetical protein [Gammaproteobacteria bacterium]